MRLIKTWQVLYAVKQQPVTYLNDPKFLDRQIWANSVDPDQEGFTVCHSVCTFWTHSSMVKPPCSNFRVIIAIFSGVQIFRIFTAIQTFLFHSIDQIRYSCIAHQNDS